MKNSNAITILIIALVIFSGCKSQEFTAGNYTYKTECIGISLDGLQTLKAWGSGRTKNEAVEQAKKQAVNDVLFNGIIEGKSVCEVKPILGEVNARTTYDDYFSVFFSDRGDYKNFVTIDEKKNAYQVVKARERITYGVVLKLQQKELKQKMKNDGILK